MRLRSPLLAATTAGLLLVPVAVAATPGDYDGWLYDNAGNRYTGTFTTMRVWDTARDQRFRLSSYNMRLTCPYLDRDGNFVRARFRFVHRGLTSGSFVDDTRNYPKKNPSHRVRIRGVFDGRTFRGRVTVTAAPRVTGACTGSARVRVTR